MTVTQRDRQPEQDLRSAALDAAAAERAGIGSAAQGEPPGRLWVSPADRGPDRPVRLALWDLPRLPQQGGQLS